MAINIGVYVDSVTGDVTQGSAVRKVVQNAQTSAYILAATDVGKHVSITTGGVTVNTNIFSIGDAVSIFNMGYHS